MPDITLCQGEGCPIKETCYRYTAVPSKYRQSYFVESPIDITTGECNHHWPVTK